MEGRSKGRSGEAKLSAGLWILLGALFFSAMNAVAKFMQNASGVHAIPALQITFSRYLFAMLVLLPFVLVRPKRLRTKYTGRYVVRTIAGFGGIALMFIAVRHVSLAAATAIGFTSPIFTMFCAAIFLGERIDSRAQMAAAIGLAGALIIASPGANGLAFGGLVAIAAAIFMGAEIVGVKWISQTKDHGTTIVFYSNLVGTVMAAFFAVPGWVWPTGGQIYLSVSVGLLATAGQGCVIKATRTSDATFLAPFFYVSLIYSAVIGYLVFGETISVTTIIGATAILASAAAMMFAPRKIAPVPAALAINNENANG